MSAAQPRQVQLLGRNVVRQLQVALRTVRIHDAGNAAAAAALQRLADAINALWSTFGGPVQLQFVEDIVFINDVRLRMGAVLADQVEALRGELESRGLGGLGFVRPVDSAALRSFLVPLSAAVDDEDDVGALQHQLRSLGDIGITLLEPRRLLDNEEYQAIRIDRLSFALQAYGRAIVAFSEVVRALERGADPLSGRVHIPRVVQDLIDIAVDRVNFLLRIPATERANAAQLQQIGADYHSRHGANTCVYSIMIGKVIGLDRIGLLDLGMGALLADIGFALLPDEWTQRADELSETERIQLRMAMLTASQRLIGHGRATDSMIRRIIVANEHHYPYLDTMTGRPAGLHLYSRIVAVADAFDALTTHRSWRPALTSDQALSVLNTETGTRYDPRVVAVLTELLRTHGAHARGLIAG